MYYHDSDAIVIIAHFCLVNCVKNAGLTPFNSTYFAHLANFEYKRRYDYPGHSTNVLLYVNFCMKLLVTVQKVNDGLFK